MNTSLLTCHVCGIKGSAETSPPVMVVACLFMRGFSDAICSLCVAAGLDSWSHLVSGVWLVGSYDKMNSVFQEAADNCLDHLGRTREELDTAVTSMEEQMTKMCKQHDKAVDISESEGEL